MITIGIDQSKRSTALCAILDGTKVLDCMLVTPPSDYDTEMLINFQWSLIGPFIQNLCKLPEAVNGIAIALEGAAFSAGGSSSDLLWGIQWYIRTRIFVEFPDIPIGIITPATWRSSIVPITEQREFKSKFGGKIGLKHAVVSKLPSAVTTMFDNYIDQAKYRILESKGLKPDGRSNKHLEGMFDLADAYGIAYHRYLISTGVRKAVKVKSETKKISTLKRSFPIA
jgi:hypothetical protein